MSDSIEVEDMTQHPSVLDVRLNGEKTVVVVNVQQMFENIFPDGRVDGDPGVWGIILSDTVRHLARAHRQALVRLSEAGNGPTPPPEEACVERLMQVLVDEMGRDDLPKIDSSTVITPKDPKARG
jgi:hypothetical protein